MSGVDTVVSDACDIDSMSLGEIVVRVGEMSLSGGGDAVVLGVDESVCGVNPVLADSIINLCGIDTVVSGVDDPMCCDSSVMTAVEFDVCSCDSLVYDGAGDSSGVEVVHDVVACGDDAILHDAVRVGGWLSVVGDTLMCGTAVARSDRRDAEVVVGPGVTKPCWLDGLICADDSLRPEPPPMHALCLCRCLLAASREKKPGHGDCLCL